MTAEATKRILVVAYSRTGTTGRLAEAIALHCEADLEWIQERNDRDGPIGYLRSAWQALWHAKPWIRPARRAPGRYALVLIGTPVWARNIAAPVRSYVQRYGARCRRVAFFCTSTGSGADKVLGDLQQLCGRRAVATLSVTQRELAQGDVDRLIEPFVRRFRGQRGDSVSGASLAA